METGSNISSAAAFPIRKGEDVITAGNTSVTFAHGYGKPPSSVQVTPIMDSTGVDIFVTTIDDTNITVNTDFAQPGNLFFMWMCS